MASEAQVILVDPAPGAADHARGRLEELERRWSRFRPDSEIARLATAPGAWVPVSGDTITLLTAMRRAWRLTHRRYDPTVLDAINAAGYTRSVDGSGRVSVQAAPAAARVSLDDMTIDSALSAAIVPAGFGLDPGGIGKGLAADIVVTELLEEGTAGALVSVGGDLAAAGRAPTAEGWYVVVEDPTDPSRSIVTLAIDAGGVATSSTLSRAWFQDDRRRHHVIDPATRTCATTDLAAVTVIASTGWEAEVQATAALLCGADKALYYLDGHGLSGIATTLNGATTMSPALESAHVLERSTV
jgi:thiamine biosynthesis lipoprotein